MARPNRRPMFALFAAVVLFAAVRLGNDALRALEPDTASVSSGTTAKGALAHGKRLPTDGPNFTTYSWLGSLVGRTAVHATVRDVLLDAYAELATTQPGHTFVYGETGWPGGGRFRPHVTHQNGLSVDFLVPLRDDAGPRLFLTWIGNLWGYGAELDAAGAWGDRRIDWDAMAAHVEALDRAARSHKARIALVIFAPELQPHLFRGHGGLRSRVPWSKKPAWIRHDEHYHVDFRLGSAS